MLQQAVQARLPGIAKDLRLDHPQAGRFRDPRLHPFECVEPGLLLGEAWEKAPPYAAGVLLRGACVDEEATVIAQCAPGLGEKILKLVTTRAKRGELVSEKEFLGLIESQARSSVRR